MSVLTEAVVGCGNSDWVNTTYGLLVPFRAHNVVMSWGVAFDGSVEHYLGLLSTVVGELDRGVEHFEAALAMNTKMGAVPLVARTQERYAALLVQRNGAGDYRRAGELLDQATQTMERVGMVGHLVRARETRRRFEEGRAGYSLGVREESAPADTVGAEGEREAAPQYLFRREGDYWSVAFEGVLVRLRHTRGLALLAVLLQHPETELHVLDLMSAVDGVAGEAADPVRRAQELRDALDRDGGPLADGQARAEYRRRLEDLRAELAEAEARNDFGRTGLLRQEIEGIAEELQRIYGRSGRSRRMPSACERARIGVRNNISYALGPLKKSNEALWRHMKTAVRTGTFCSYQPERVIPWTF